MMVANNNPRNNNNNGNVSIIIDQTMKYGRSLLKHGYYPKQTSCMGSLLIKMGHTKVLCEVHIMPSSSSDDVTVGSLFCTVKDIPPIGINEVTHRSKQTIKCCGC
jgi:hypothetical protein